MSSKQKNINLALSRSFAALGMVFSLFGLVTGISTSISTQAAPVYSCPAGSVLAGTNCTATVCLDNSAPIGGNCTSSQYGLFPCNGANGTRVMQPYYVGNQAFSQGLCTSKPNIFVMGRCPGVNALNTGTTPVGQQDGSYVYSGLAGQGNEYENIMNNFANDTVQNQMCQVATVTASSGSYGGATYGALTNARACPQGYGVYMIPAKGFHNLDSNPALTSLCMKYGTPTAGLQSIAYSTGYRPKDCNTLGFVELYATDLNGGDAEAETLCIPATPRPAAVVGTTLSTPATITSNSPDGWLDGISSTGVASGWATDADVPNTSLDVHFYIDGSTSNGTYIGKTTASYVRPDLPAPYNTGKNGYDFRIPEAYCDNNPHTLYAYGIDAPAYVTNPLLNGSPKSFTLSPAQCGYSTTISNSNVGTGNCGTGNIALQGSTANCSFPLTGSPTSLYTLPSQGLMAALLVTGGNTTSDYGKSNPCTVSGSTLTCNNIPVPSNTQIGAREIAILQPTVQWMMNKGFVNVQAGTVITNGTQITQTNTGNGTCSPSQISVGNLTTCSYPLTGDVMSQYTLPLAPIKTKISTVTNSSADCQIFNNATPNASLVCANVPSLGGTIGAQTATLNLTGETNSAPINLAAGTAMSTVITADQTGNGTCTPVTITIGNLTLCDFPLTGAMNNTYAMPISGINAQISTANSLSTPCQISNNGTINASLTCTQVPTSGATPGSQTAKLNLVGEMSSAPVTLKAATTTLGSNPMGELSGKIGELVSGYITTTGSTYSGPAAYSNGTSCNITGVMSLGIFSPVQGSLVPGDCPVGSLSNGVIKAGGNVDLPGVKSNFARSGLTIGDLKNIDIQCNGGKAVTVNSTTTCTFQLPDNKILPKELLFGIGDSKPAGICTLKDKTITCVNTPTGSKLGVQGLNARIDGGSTFDTGKKIMVNASGMLSKTGNNIGFIFGLAALMATSFSLALTMSLSLAKQKK
ncbi:MAG: hypothetical protein H7230_00520 [Candidatus Parcubacteria bacterium]|nr:hypothetical protein [Candidatus Paceibacterota bacterium]